MEPAVFIAICRQLQGGNLSPGVGEAAQQGITNTMTVRYAMPFPPTVQSTFHPTSRPTRTRRGQWHELVQHLTDLAYLTPEVFQSWHQVRARGGDPYRELLLAVAGAVAQFLEEDDYAGYRLMPAFPAGGLTPRLEWLEEYLPPVVHRLAGYTSFDGDTGARPGYEIGEQTAFGRSLAYRLRVLFYHFRQAHTSRRAPYFTHKQLPLLYQLDNTLHGAYREQLPGRDGIFLPVDLQELLLDGHRLFAEYRRANRFQPDAREGYFLQYTLSDSEAGEEEWSKREERLARRADKRIKQSELHEHTGGNQLGIRLLQLTLWRAGFYTGVLDGAFGRLSHRAVLALVAQERDHGDWKDRRLDRVVVRAEQAGSWLVDLKLVGRLLDAYAPPSEAEAEREEGVIWETIVASGQEATLDRQFAERQREVKFAYGEPENHPFRRVYYGLRSLLRGAFRAVGRVVAWIAGAVETLLGAVFDFVKAVAKRLQEGIGLFFTGFRYFAHLLLGRPFVTLGTPTENGGPSPLLYTRYRLDFDVVNLTDAAAGQADQRRHQDYIQRILAGATYFLEVIAGAIRLIARLQPPLGWLRLGIMVARHLRDLLSGRDERSDLVA